MDPVQTESEAKAKNKKHANANTIQFNTIRACARNLRALWLCGGPAESGQLDSGFFFFFAFT